MGSLTDKINTSLHQYYQRKASTAESTSQEVGWKNQNAQQVRFDQLLKIVGEKGNETFSINDFGCGLGDLANYMESKGYKSFSYMGYDMFGTMVTKAEQLHVGNPHTVFKQITSPHDLSIADYTVASGVLNIRFGISDDDWLAFIKDTISVLNSRSTKGFAFNALTKYSDKEYMQEELYYADPCALFDFCKRNFSKNVALLHDYQEYDFTILVRK